MTIEPMTNFSNAINFVSLTMSVLGFLMAVAIAWVQHRHGALERNIKLIETRQRCLAILAQLSKILWEERTFNEGGKLSMLDNEIKLAGYYVLFSRSLTGQIKRYLEKCFDMHMVYNDLHPSEGVVITFTKKTSLLNKQNELLTELKEDYDKIFSTYREECRVF